MRGNVGVAIYEGLPSYIGTPKGKVRKYNPGSNKFSPVTNDAPFDNSVYRNHSDFEGSPSLRQIGKGAYETKTQPVRKTHEYD